MEKNNHLQKLLCANMSMGDVDELTERMAGWDNDWRQLDTGQALNQIGVISGQTAVIQQVRLSHSVHQQGKTPDQLMTFGFPDMPNVMMWNGQPVSCPAVFDFNGANGYDAVSGAGFRGVTLSLPKKTFLSVAERLSIPVSHLLSAEQPYDLTNDNSALNEFRLYLYRLYACLRNTANQDGRHYTRFELDEELPVRLITALAGSRQDLNLQPLKVRQKGLRLAVEFIEEYGQENPSIPDICRATGLSWRSLDRAFRECFGVGPKRYMMNFRLTNVRRSLTNQPSGAAIFEAANSWGFWHMGDFAREYRKMFSELPSETLRQRYQ